MTLPYLRSHRLSLGISAVALALFIGSPAPGAGKKPLPDGPRGEPVLWRDPADLGQRDLYYGPGGKANEPHGAFKFVAEDMAGTSPKFDIVGEDGTKWRVKLGREARPETAASRLVWAVGYFANQDYLMSTLQVQDLPKLRRGEKDVKAGGIVNDARLKRHVKGEEKIGPWSWQKCPFAGSREWYGLRVLMAVLNNWDLKDINNAIYRVGGEHVEERYLVSDLGASFGATGLNRAEKDDLDVYRSSKWINGRTGDYVDFNVPSQPSIKYLVVVPEMVRRNGLIWLGRHIPLEDARWMGSLLGRLSPQQIRDAFRAAGYSPQEIEGFSREVERRIGILNSL